MEHNDTITGLQKLAIPAAAGAFVHVILAKGKPLFRLILEFLAGFFVSLYLTPIVEQFFSIDRAYENGLAFVIGYMGIKIAEAMATMKAEDIQAFIKRLLNIK